MYIKIVGFSKKLIEINVAKDGTITVIEILRASKVFSGDVNKVIRQEKPLVA